MPSNPQCTFSPTALKFYLNFTVTTRHLDSLSIFISPGVELTFPSIPTFKHNKLLDYHHFTIVRPRGQATITLQPQPSVASATSDPPLTRLLVHQRLSHGCDEVLDTMCRKQSLLGLPHRPFPHRHCPCII
jgi:hypothetical protein